MYGSDVAESMQGSWNAPREQETYTRHEGFFDERRDYGAFPYAV